MSRNSVYFGVLEKPAKPRTSHEQLADELASWLAQGNRIQQLPVSQSQQCPGNWKAQEKLKGRVK